MHKNETDGGAFWIVQHSRVSNLVTIFENLAPQIVQRPQPVCDNAKQANIAKPCQFSYVVQLLVIFGNYVKQEKQNK